MDRCCLFLIVVLALTLALFIILALTLRLENNS